MRSVSRLAVIMLRSITCLLCLLPYIAFAGEEKCIPYAIDVAVAGKLERHTFPGRPNYESIAEGDEAESGFYLRLPHVICTNGDPKSPDAYPQKTVRLVQLVLQPAQYDELRPLLGKTVSVKGDLFARHTGHHHAPLLLNVKSHEQLSAAAPETFSLANKSGDELDAEFRWEANGLAASVNANGMLTLNGSMVDQQQRHTKLPLENREWISRLSALERGESLFLAFDTDDGDSGRGMLCRVTTKLRSIRWCRDIPGFNISAAIAYDGAIFVGAIGFLGRVDTKAGTFLWKQSGLYANDKTFNIFCALEEAGERISWFGTTGTPASIGKRVVLDRRTEKINSITDAELLGGCH